MGNIISDIVEEIDVKPNKSKLMMKWVVSISLSLITAAFLFGQFKASFFGRLDEMETKLDNNTQSTTELTIEMTNGFDAVNRRIDKVYDDASKEFTQFQKYNNKKLEMIIDYGSTSKNILKQMLEITAMEESKKVEENLQQAKKEMPEFNIVVQPLKPKK